MENGEGWSIGTPSGKLNAHAEHELEKKQQVDQCIRPKNVEMVVNIRCEKLQNYLGTKKATKYLGKKHRRCSVLVTRVDH